MYTRKWRGKSKTTEMPLALPHLVGFTSKHSMAVFKNITAVPAKADFYCKSVDML